MKKFGLIVCCMCKLLITQASFWALWISYVGTTEVAENEASNLDRTGNRRLVFAHTSLFGYEVALSALKSVELATGTAASHVSTGEQNGKRENAVLSSAVDMSSELSIRVLGALISWLAKNALLSMYVGEKSTQADELNQDLEAAPCLVIGRLRLLELEDVLHLTPQALYSLNVVQTDSHPLLGGCGKAKEGVSLAGILDFTVSVPGRRLLKNWVLRPSSRRSFIEERHKTVQMLHNWPNETIKLLRHHLKGIKNISGVAFRIRTARGNLNDWINLHRAVTSILAIKNIVRSVCGSQFSVDDDDSWIQQFLTSSIVDSEVKAVLEAIDGVLDIELSITAKKPHIRTGYSTELDEYRSMFDALDELLTNVGVEEMQSLAGRGLVLSRLFVSYYPQIGFLIVVQKEIGDSDTRKADGSLSEEFVTELGFSFVFCSDEHAYYKSDRMFQLDHDIGDIHGVICDEENQALQQLELKVVPFLSIVLSEIYRLAELDCFICFSLAAEEYGWVCPVMDDESRIEVVEGRHPLTDLLIDRFVSNSFHSVGGHVTIVTGPNFSGKSVYLKQTALIVYLAQIGSFVPARSARLGVMTKILVQLRHFESISLNQSSFGMDCCQIAYLLHHMDHRSLILVDEFGKGTDVNDAVGLNVSLIKSFLSCPAENAPIVLLSTHLAELFQRNFVDLSNPKLSLANMETSEVARDPNLADLDCVEDLVFLYRVRMISAACDAMKTSHAMSLAARCGVPHDVIRRAVNIFNSLRGGHAIHFTFSFAELRSKCARLLHFLSAFTRVDFGKLRHQEMLAELSRCPS